MKGIISLLAIAACVGARSLFAAAADEQWQKNWFNAIGKGAAQTPSLSNNLSATNGTWTIEATGASVSEGKLVLDYYDECASFVIAENKAQDTNTITRMEVDISSLETTAADALPTPANAQFAFTVVKNQDSSLQYYVWTGASWIALTGATPDPQSGVKLTVEVDYRTTTHYVTLKVGDATLTTTGDNPVSKHPLVSKANQLGGMRLYGCGTLASVDADLQLGVAQYDGVKYGTIAEAMAAIPNDAQSGEVTVLRATSESVTLPSGKNINLVDNGKVNGTVTAPEGAVVAVKPTVAEFTGGGTSGEHTLPVKVSGDGDVAVVLPMANKEIEGTPEKVAGGVKVKIRTATSLITAAAPGGKALDANATKLHAFLNAHANAAYIAADVSTASISTALSGTGSNTLPLWQDYVLGIAPTDSIKPVTLPTGDTSTSAITLAIPAIDTSKYSGDYTVQYKVGETVQSGPSAITVPQATGTYDVKVVLTPATK